MASLTDQQIKDSYEQVLIVDNDGGGNGITLVTVTDGDGETTFPLQLATNKISITDGANDLDIASHDGTNGLKLGGTLVTASATEINVLDGVTAGTVTASKAIVVDSSSKVNVWNVDNIVINGTTIGHSSDTDLLTFTSGVLTVAGEISVTTLDIGGTNITATATELNIMDGSETTQATVTLAGTDGVVISDVDVMKQCLVSDFLTYMESNIDALSSLVTVGTITSGTWEGTTVAVAQGGTGVTSKTGTGNVVLSSSPTLVTPALGTPASGTATNITGLPIVGGTTGTLTVARGGTGATSLTDKAVLISQDSGTDTVGSLVLSTNGQIVVGGTSGPAVMSASSLAGAGLSSGTGDGTLALSVEADQSGQITSVGTLTGFETTDESPTFTSATASKPVVDIISTNTGSNWGYLRFTNDRASATGLGQIVFRGKESIGNYEDYASITGISNDIASTDEVGKLQFTVKADGSDTVGMTIVGTDDLDGKARVGIGNATPRTSLDVHHNPTGLSADTGGGEVVLFGSGSLTAGKMYYLNSSGAWTLTDANDVAKGASQLIGIALGSDPTADGVLIRGFFDVASYLTGTFVQGGAVYVSETTTGNIDVAAPAGGSDFVRIVGYGTTTANVIYFNPSSAWVEIA